MNTNMPVRQARHKPEKMILADDMDGVLGKGSRCVFCVWRGNPRKYGISPESCLFA